MTLRTTLRRLTGAVRGLWARLAAGSTDPVTGDHLTTSEHASWMVQRVMRRWSFLGLITVITIICWSLNDTVRLWWNYAASWGALAIEGITAMALINQTRRDARVLRDVRDIAQRTERIARIVLRDVKEIDEEIVAHGEHDAAPAPAPADEADDQPGTPAAAVPPAGEE